MLPFDISVVIGFRDWGPERLRLSLESIQAAFGNCRGETILVDYGSKDAGPARRAAEISGAQLVRIDDAKVWSRSRALNAGFAAAKGDLLISTDADMLFEPGTLQVIHSWWVKSGSSALFLQCRDLPETLSVQDLSTGLMDWRELEQVSQLRPRWGVGGMMAIDRESFGVIRGFDERMHTYGREDMDFAARARRSGLRMVWVEDSRARMYHMWHPSSADAVMKSPEAQSALKQNRRIFDDDQTVVRNRTVWRHTQPDAKPIVSICLPNGFSATSDSDLESMLALQSVCDIEVLLPSTGEFHLGENLNSIVRVENCLDGDLKSLLAVATGNLTIILDQDYSLPETFLEELLASMHGAVRAVVPYRVAFDPMSGGLEIIPEDDRSIASPMGGVLIDTNILRSLVSEEITCDSRSDFLELLNNLGLESAHSEKSICLIKANETIQVTANLDALPVEVKKTMEQLLPGRPVARVANIIDGPIENLASVDFDGSLQLCVIKRNGDIASRSGILGDASLADLVKLRKNGYRIEVEFKRHELSEGTGRGVGWIVTEIYEPIDDLDIDAMSVIVCEGDTQNSSTNELPIFQLIIERIDINVHDQKRLFFCRDSSEVENVLKHVGNDLSLVLVGSNFEEQS